MTCRRSTTSAVRWELRPRLFLRTSEFLWQEGHTAHETEEERAAEALTILHDVYADTIGERPRDPPAAGPEEREERFPGAVDTYTLEALMRDGKGAPGSDLALPGPGLRVAVRCPLHRP